MATAISSLPQQQQQMQPNSEAVASGTVSHASGSIGPFFAVISVLTILAILSCWVGRRCSRGTVTPLDSIKHRDWVGWVKRKCCGGCLAGDIEVGAKVMGFGQEGEGGKAKDGVAQQPPQP